MSGGAGVCATLTDETAQVGESAADATVVVKVAPIPPIVQYDQCTVSPIGADSPSVAAFSTIFLAGFC